MCLLIRTSEADIFHKSIDSSRNNLLFVENKNQPQRTSQNQLEPVSRVSNPMEVTEKDNSAPTNAVSSGDTEESVHCQ